MGSFKGDGEFFANNVDLDDLSDGDEKVQNPEKKTDYHVANLEQEDVPMMVVTA